jgi:hypothetical protein
MIRLTLTPSLILAVLLCGSPSRTQAQGSTPITIKDGGSILLHASGLDAGAQWNVSPDEIKHLNGSGMLSAVQITEAGADRCNGDTKCGIDLTQAWTIKISHASGWVAIGSVSGNKGLHLTHHKLPFDLWKPTGNTDEREFGHGDGHRIKGVRVNGGPNLCGGHGCVVTVIYTTP